MAILLVFIAGGYSAICFLVYFKQESLIFFPEKLDQNYKFPFAGNFEEKFFKTEEGVSINALHFKTENPKGVVLYLHGNSGSLNSWGIEGDYFNDIGYDCLIYDFRGFGKSKGPSGEKGFHDDAKYLYNYLTEHYEEKDIILIGRSIGTGFATKLASETNPGMLILMTPYYSLAGLAKNNFKWLPVRLILKYKIDTYKWIRAVKCPILILHGDKDEVIPFDDSAKLLKHIKSYHELITLKGCLHNDISLYNDYHEVIKRWLTEMR